MVLLISHLIFSQTMLHKSLNRFVKILFLKIPGPYWGLMSVVAGLTGDLIAYLLFQGYNLEYMVSDLGIGQGAIFFNIGTILSGLFALFFYLYLSPYLKVESLKEEIHTIAINLAVLSCIFFIFIGIFPSVWENRILFTIHGVFAMLSWITGICYKSLFSILMLKNNKFLKFHAYTGFAVVLVEIAFLFTWISLIEWIMVFAITLWISILTCHTFQKKEIFQF